MGERQRSAATKAASQEVSWGKKCPDRRLEEGCLEPSLWAYLALDKAVALLDKLNGFTGGIDALSAAQTQATNRALHADLA